MVLRGSVPLSAFEVVGSGFGVVDLGTLDTAMVAG
jgi:hypothetical protein